MILPLLKEHPFGRYAMCYMIASQEMYHELVIAWLTQEISKVHDLQNNLHLTCCDGMICDLVGWCLRVTFFLLMCLFSGISSPSVPYFVPWYKHSQSISLKLSYLLNFVLLYLLLVMLCFFPFKWDRIGDGAGVRGMLFPQVE